MTGFLKNTIHLTEHNNDHNTKCPYNYGTDIRKTILMRANKVSHIISIVEMEHRNQQCHCTDIPMNNIIPSPYLPDIHVRTRIPSPYLSDIHVRTRILSPYPSDMHVRTRILSPYPSDMHVSTRIYHHMYLIYMSGLEFPTISTWYTCQDHNLPPHVPDIHVRTIISHHIYLIYMSGP